MHAGREECPGRGVNACLLQGREGLTGAQDYRERRVNY